LPLTVCKSIVKELHTTLHACAAYIPARLVHTQLANPQPGRISGHFWHGSILLADLSGFTTFCDKLSVLGKQGAEEVSTVINQLFDTLVAEVITFQGELLKFGGDALIALFDAETLGPSHATIATLAALSMQSHMSNFARLETRAGTFRLGLRIGVHSGRFFAAEVGDASHIELVITGEEVKRVATLQQNAAPGEVIVSDHTACLLKEARLMPREDGIYRVISLPDIPLPTQPEPLTFPQGHDIETLKQLAQQVTALRPYLLHDLPGRFMDPTIFEVGEFRPVTILFAHIHDFSTLLALINEDTHLAATVLNAYYRRVQTMVHSYGGVINKVDMYPHGDKLMALFGAPTAHENDPLRATHCALELETVLKGANAEILGLLQASSLISEQQPLVEKDTSLLHPFIPGESDTSSSSHTSLKQRIGINTGTVFAGRVGGMQRYEYTVMGPAVNLAARLMEAADDSAILISPATRVSVERHIAVIEQPPIHVKGMDDMVIPSRVFDAEHVQASSHWAGLVRPPLIGRDPELSLILEQAKTALRSNGHVLLIEGEAGMGKTRMVEELARHLILSSVSEEPDDAIPSFQIYTGDGQSFTQSVPYITLRTPLSNLLGLTIRQDETRQSLPKEDLAAQLQNRVDELAPEFSHFMPLIGDVLGIELDETPLIKAFSVEQRYERTQDLLEAIFLGSATREPMLLVIDDLQWADSSSFEVLIRLANHITSVPMLIVLAYRPASSLNHLRTILPTVTYQSLHELSATESSHFLSAMLNGTPPPEIVTLLERAHGNPFFIEELARTLVSSGTLALDTMGHWRLTCPPEQVAVPTSIEGVIIARLDRLEEPYYELVQVASVIGYRFQVQILQGVYRYPNLLRDGLQHLIDSDIILIDEKQQDKGYLFRHALLRDVAYEGILYAQRRELHRRVAQRIEELSTGHLDEHLALLANHYLLAEDWESSFRYHISAGVQAQKRFANQDAIMLFDTALSIAPHLQQSSSDYISSVLPGYDILSMFNSPLSVTLKVSELYERRGFVYARLGEYDKALPSYLEALKLINQLSIEHARWDINEKHFPVPHSQLATTTVRLHRHLAELQEQRANYDSAFEWLEKGMALSTSESQTELARCYLLGSRIYYSQGEFQKSLEWARWGLSVAESMGNTIDQAHALLLMGNLWRDRGEFNLSIPALERARTLLDLMKDATRLSEALKNLGEAYWRVGRWQDAIKCYQKSLQISENVGDALGKANTSNNLALVMVGRGELEFATDLYKYSSEQYRRIGSLLGLAIIGYNEAHVLLLQGKPRDALHLLRASIASLENIKARNSLPEALRFAAEAALELDEIKQARTYATRSLSIACELGMVGEEAITRRVMGQIALAKKDFAAARECLEQSRGMLEKLENRYELGKVLFVQARMQEEAGCHDTSVTLLEHAEHIFKGLRARHDLALISQFRKTLLQEQHA
jgi:class 3 adenylate cyclase/tetratricopeptide (TPR) repeat protein